MFHKEFSNLEERMVKFTKHELGKLSEEVQNLRSDMGEMRTSFEGRIDDYKR